MIVADLNTFSGIDNVSTDLRLTGKSISLKSADNIFITNKGTIKTRPVTSIYSNEKAPVIWIDIDGKLYTGNYGTTFARCGDLVFKSNGYTITCINGSMESFDNIPPNLKPLPAGQIFYCKGRLFSIKDNLIYYSEPYMYLYYDYANTLVMPSPVVAYKSAREYFVVATENNDVRLINFSAEVPKQNIVLKGKKVYSLEYLEEFVSGNALVHDVVVITTDEGIYITDGMTAMPVNINYHTDYEPVYISCANNNFVITLTGG